MSIVREQATVVVPATSANLGPGFDSLGLALGIYDEITARATTGATEVTIHGQGADRVATDERNLVVRALRVGLEAAGAPECGLELTCHNRIPHGRGLGSSAAAVVAGLMLARGLTTPPLTASEFDPASRGVLNDELLLELATEFEGHPDNVAPALHGGATVAYVDGDGRGRAARVPLGRDLPLTVLVPEVRLATKKARAALPASVPHGDAAFNVARACLLVLALAGGEVELLTATEDRLHQDARRASMPGTVGAVDALRRRGLPAVVSGAGPSILVLAHLDAELRSELSRDWQVLTPSLDMSGARLR